jgi:hypothetical protein
MQQRTLVVSMVLVGSLAGHGAADAAEKKQAAEKAGGTRARVVPQADYQAGPIHRTLFGSGYRKLWATPIEVEVLDLSSFAGGLTPKKKGGGKQTLSLTFEGRDGHEWKFRSIDKDPTPVLPKPLQRGFANAIAQDQISASLPTNALIVDALAKASGIMTVPHTLVVLPDDPRLGEFREKFAGLLGTLEEDPQTKSPVTPGFERFSELLETAELWERMDQDASERIDDREFLRARLFDMLIGDYDRHKDQWDFGKDRTTGLWIPIPKDRDLAFVKFDGMVISLIRPSAPRLVDFEDEYPSIVGLTWQARFLDRRHLSGLEWADWQQVAQDLKARLTNPVIDDAVKQLPPEFYRIAGPGLAERLKKRRDRLADAAHKFYALLARQTEIHASNQADTVETVRREDGGFDLVASGPEGPFLRRRFVKDETSEVRVFLKGGDDRAVTHGEGAGDGVKLRVVGGPGNDVLDDSDSGHSRFYDETGENRVVKGEGTKFSARPYTHPLDGQDNPERDWGHTTGVVPWVRAGGGFGVLLGLELRHTDFGFRKHPYGDRHKLRVAYSTELNDFGGHYSYESLRTDNRARFAVDASISDLTIIRYHGFGNDTPSDQPEDFYDVSQRQYTFEPAYRFDTEAFDLSIGPVVKFATTRFGDEGPTLLEQENPYGTGDFGQVGARVAFLLDRRDHPDAATRGAYLEAEGSVYPKAWDVEETFGVAQAETGVYATAPIVFKPTLALRVGGQHAWGRYPFHESAFVGGATIRGLRRQRYAGDSSAYGNAELRLTLVDRGEAFLSRVGIFGLADGGRVWLAGESSDTWHHGVGGGVFVSVMKPENVWSFSVAQSEGRTRVYLLGGFMF